jgi:WD40 repeat protein
VRARSGQEPSLPVCAGALPNLLPPARATGEAVQEYNYHLGPVNTVTFIDEGRQFVSTSDDKTIRVWEFGIPVQIKYIADPSMHSMPAVAMHPSHNYLLMQSLDNQVREAECGEAGRTGSGAGGPPRSAGRTRGGGPRASTRATRAE